MDHEPVLISTIAIGLVAAFIGGLIAQRLRLPSIVGYIAAGVALGPFTPGVIADQEIADRARRDRRDPADVRCRHRVLDQGPAGRPTDRRARARSASSPSRRCWASGSDPPSAGGSVVGLILGLAISVASTVVLLRTLNDRGELDTPQGRIAVGWLIVEDLFTVVILVVLPTIAPLIGGLATADGGTGDSGLAAVGSVVLALGKAAVFAVIMIVVGARLVPWLLNLVARDGSRELFTLAVLAIALGIAFVSSTVFGVSFALGAFLAGAVVGESDMSHQAAADALPAARRLRGAVLRVGRDAPRSRLPGGVSARDPRHGRADRRRQGGRQVRDRHAVRVPPPDRAHRRGRPGPDRRVLVHPGHGGGDARAPAARGVPVDRRGIAALDRPESVPLPGRRPAGSSPPGGAGPDAVARATGGRPRVAGIRARAGSRSAGTRS